MRVRVLQMMARFIPIAAVLLLAACGAPTTTVQAPPSEYAAVQDGEFFIQAVDASLLKEGHARREVDYGGPEGPGTIVVDTFARKLYLVGEGGRAMRYAIGVGREGLEFSGGGVIGRKAEWPSWQPTRNMIRTSPELYAHYAGGVPGGMDNPLGARALYLYRGGRDTYFRIHGTLDNLSIGRASSAHIAAWSSTSCPSFRRERKVTREGAGSAVKYQCRQVWLAKTCPSAARARQKGAQPAASESSPRNVGSLATNSVARTPWRRSTAAICSASRAHPVSMVR